MAKILLVEDDKSLREIYGVRLMAEGYEIVSAGDGEEALAMAIKERPNLIVSDVMMPKISGFDMLDILRSTTETKDVKVIMMTALSSDDQRARGEALGADRYLVKSQVGIEDVVRTVHDVLGDGLPGVTAPVAATAPAFPPAAPAPVAPVVPAPEPLPAPVMPEPVAAPVFNPAPSPDPIPAVAPLPPQPVTSPVIPEYAAPEPVQAPAAMPEVTVPAPTTPPEPAPAPAVPTMPDFTAPQPVPIPAPIAPAPQPSMPMPQPTAPFSTPAPASLGERVIAPLTNPTDTTGTLDVAAQMEQALNTPPGQTPGTPPTL